MRSMSASETPSPRCGVGRRCSPAFSAAGVLRHLVAAVAIGVLDRPQHLRKTGPAPARRRREIGPAPERLARGRQKHGQRPAALLAEEGQRMLIDRIEIGPLLAVDLDD